MITYKQIDRSYFEAYDKIPMLVHVKSTLNVEKINSGLGGFNLKEVPVRGYAYYTHKEFRDEVQLIWYLEL